MGKGRTHRPERDAAVCMSCGGCTWRCPATVFSGLRGEEGSLRGEIYRTRPFEGEVASEPPCVLACPLGQDVPGYVSAIAAGDLERAAETIRRTNALPSVCGRACLASCMRACTRAGIDEGVDIRGLKRFAVVAAGSNDEEPAVPEAKDPPVAVIGAGPAGLAAAHRLAQLGRRAVVFDAEEIPGGSLADTVPSFVLPREHLAADVERLERLGVSFRTGTRVGRDVAWEEVEEGYGAIIVATGARRGFVPEAAGDYPEGVVSAPAFCRGAGVDGRRIEGPVVVSGGGFAALQSARVALRLGAKTASVVHPAPAEQWPAGADAIGEASAEGVRILDMHRVTALSSEDGRLAGVDVKAVKASSPDAVDRHSLASYGKAERLEASWFVGAVERRPAPQDPPRVDGVGFGVIGNLRTDSGFSLGRDGWFACGEAATGAATIVDSMGTGRLAAEAVDRYLGTGGAR